MNKSFKRLLVFLAEVGLAAVVVLSVHVYPDVRWLYGIAVFTTYAWVILGVVMALVMNSTLTAARKSLKEHESLEGIDKSSRGLVETLGKSTRGAISACFSWLSGLAFLAALASCEWYVLATVQLIFGEIWFNTATRMTRELYREIKESKNESAEKSGKSPAGAVN